MNLLKVMFLGMAALVLGLCLSSCQNFPQRQLHDDVAQWHGSVCPFEKGSCSHCSSEPHFLSEQYQSAQVHQDHDLAVASTAGESSSEVIASNEAPSGLEALLEDPIPTPSQPQAAQSASAPEEVEPVWNRIQQRQKMVIGVKADAPPFGVLRDDGQYWGFEIDLAMAVAEALGVELELVPVTAKQRTPYLLQDKVDLIMATMTMTQKREEVVDFSIPYFEVGQGLIIHADSDIQDFQGLKGKKVAVLEGTQAFHTLRRIQPDCFLVIVDSYATGIDGVLSKEVDALCSDHLLLMGLLHDHPGMALLSLVEQTFAPDPYAVAMRENESTLRDAVNMALMKFWEEGIWQDTYETWFGLGSMYSHELLFRIDMIPE